MYGYDEVAQTYEPEGVVNADGEMVMAMFVSNISELEFQSVKSIQITVNINPGSTPVTINQTKTENSLHGELKNKSWIQVQFPTSNSVLITGNDFSETDLLDLQLVVNEIIRIYYTGPAGDCFTHQISGQWRFAGMQTPSPPCAFEIPTGCQNVSGCFPSVSLSGLIRTHPLACVNTFDLGLDQASVHIYDQDPFGSIPAIPVMTVMTDVNGNYEATPLEPGRDYWVVPEKQHNPDCGLTMDDQSILHFHILGGNPITDNWKRFVANVSYFDLTLSTYDVLGIHCRIVDCAPHPFHAFPHSWIFMKSADWIEWVFHGNWTPSHPNDVPPAEQFYYIEDVSVDINFLDFRAGKAGDIEPSCTDCSNNMFAGEDELAVTRNENSVPLVEGSVHKMDDTSTISIPFYMPEVRDNQMWLVALGFPIEDYIIENVQPMGIEDRAHFIWNVQEELEALSVIWSPSLASPMPVDRQLPTFIVTVRRVDGLKIDTSPFFLKAHPATDGVVEGLYNIRPWELIREEPAIHLNESTVRVFPNPASETLWISSRESLGVGTFKIYDLYGRLAQTQSLAPMHAGELYALDITLIPQGMYYFVYNTTNGRYSGKVSVVK
jgi:hypothetical protein